MDILSALAQNIPAMAAWITGIVLSAMMVRRGGGKLEKILLIGCCLMLVTQLAGLAIYAVFRPIFEAENNSITDIARDYSIVNMVRSVVLVIPSFILIVYAFWKKFWRPRGAKL